MSSRSENTTDLLNLDVSISLSTEVTGNLSLNFRRKQYIFTPAGLDVKLPLSLLIAVSAVIGLVGNLCVLRFTNKEEKNPLRARCSKLNFFIRSLAMSDVLGSLVGAPLVLTQINLDVFQSKWPCITCRVIQIVFFSITFYNLMVVALERYIGTCRPTCRPLSLITVKKAVNGAWVLGLLLTLLSSYTFDGIRVDLNDTHYTVVCMYDYNDYSKRVVQHIFVLLVYILPTLVLMFACACIIRVLWNWAPNVVEAQPTALEALRTWRIKQKKATAQLMVIIIAFIAPYIFLLGYVLFNSITTPSIEFKTNYAIRYTGISLAYLTGSVNFFIHLAQLTGFRQTIRGYLVCCEKYELATPRNRARNHKAANHVKADHCRERRASMSHMPDSKRCHRVQEKRHSF